MPPIYPCSDWSVIIGQELCHLDEYFHLKIATKTDMDNMSGILVIKTGFKIKFWL